MSPRSEISCLTILCIASLVTCNDFNSSQHYDNLTAAFPDLHGWDDKYERPPSIGGQNFTQCCLKAVRESLEIPTGGGKVGWSTAHNWVLDSDGSPITIEEFGKAQFPCGAAYDEDHAHGAPLVKVPYTWCDTNCGGWQKSSNSDLNQWVQPFVGFILPSAVFCLSVPRRSILTISNGLFINHFEELPVKLLELRNSIRSKEKARSNMTSFFDVSILAILNLGVYLIFAFIMAVFRAAIAAAISLANTVVGGGTDSEDEVLDAVFHKRVHELYALLVGNLTLPTTVEGGKYGNVWTDVKLLVDGPKLKQKNEIKKYKEVTRERLKALLDCQASFGVVIGAPIVFFVGSFLYSIFENLNNVGDNDTSHALAFGSWWMIIPHVAIVSGCLLAGNNPDTLQVIMCSVDKPHEISTTVKQNKTQKLFGSWWRPFYHSIYTPIPMVERGRNKCRWIEEVAKLYLPLSTVENTTDETREIPQNSRRKAGIPGNKTTPRNHQLNSWHWLEIGLIEIVLLGLPFVLAFLTSFYTPPVGLSCRTFTFLLYFLLQVCFIAIWIWEFYDSSLLTPWRPFDDDKDDVEKANTRSNASSSPKEGTSDTVTSSKAATPPTTGNRKALEWVHGILLTIVLAGSFFITIFGTFFQVVGLYRNCKCRMPLRYWSSKNFSYAISNNTQDAINFARKTWLPTGVTSIVLLIVTCYIGWWYQRHWRMAFDDTADKLLGVKKPPAPKSTDEDRQGVTNESQLKPAREVSVPTKEKTRVPTSPKTAVTDATPSTSKSGANVIEENPIPIASDTPVAPVTTVATAPPDSVPAEPQPSQAQPKAVPEEGEKSESK
ncbi:hypothetical protein BJ875DRAFT_484421 [Amylocarpus encephaloides]|uniref:Uncharacterized protein n=1 Tax=Amylocarpus encephaloides TaxID=45428 RepID=A0A9P7YJN3_9HELO|nr:hypothetical protein BJ875DRAFT_484421 [Amylocarpus encephaloides]